MCVIFRLDFVLGEFFYLGVGKPKVEDLEQKNCEIDKISDQF